MTASELALQIYDDTLGFLKEGGYIEHINTLLEKESIDDRNDQD